MMRLRSLLFVPGDRPDRMDKALNSGADALLLDLEDSVDFNNKPAARAAVAGFLHAVVRTDVALFVRVNSLDGSLIDDDLDAVLPARPTGIVLPKAEGAVSITDVSRRMGLRGGSGQLILPIATETPKAIFKLGEYEDVRDRLLGITWGAEDLSTAVGASSARLPDGGFAAPFETARALTLFAAAAADVPPIETVYPAILDLTGLAANAERAARDGFLGMMAVHPAQVPVINAAFTPSHEDVARSQAVIDAFAASPGAGVLTLDGKMIDRPHLRRAEATMQRCGVRTIGRDAEVG